MASIVNKLRVALGFKELQKEKEPGIGIYWLWQLPKSHPFYSAALVHDQRYDERKAGLIKDKTSKQADVEFLLACLRAAKGSWYYTQQAKLFYYIVRAWGRLFWPKPVSPQVE